MLVIRAMEVIWNGIAINYPASLTITDAPCTYDGQHGLPNTLYEFIDVKIKALDETFVIVIDAYRRTYADYMPSQQHDVKTYSNIIHIQRCSNDDEDLINEARMKIGDISCINECKFRIERKKQDVAMRIMITEEPNKTNDGFIHTLAI